MAVSVSGSTSFKRISREETTAMEEYTKKLKNDKGQVELCLCNYENYAATGNNNDQTTAMEEYAKKLKNDKGQVELCLCNFENYAATGNNNDGCGHFSKLRFGLKTVKMDDPDFMQHSIVEWVHAVAAYLRLLSHLAHAP